MKIGGTNGVNGNRPIYPSGPQDRRPQQAGKNVQGDRVEISDAAWLQGAISRVPEIRQEKVTLARQMIAGGEMDTPERMAQAVDRMLAELMDSYGAFEEGP